MHSHVLLPAVVLGAAATASAVVRPAVATSLTPWLIPLEQDAGSDNLFPMPPCGSFQLEEATIDQMQEAMTNGTLTSVQLVMCYMMRMYQTDEFVR